MPNIGPMELVIVLVIALLVLGPKKLPEVGKSLGKGLREFKDSVSGLTGGDDDDTGKDPFGNRQVQARHDDDLVPAPEPRTEPDVHPDPEAPAPKRESVS